MIIANLKPPFKPGNILALYMATKAYPQLSVHYLPHGKPPFAGSFVVSDSIPMSLNLDNIIAAYLGRNYDVGQYYYCGLSCTSGNHWIWGVERFLVDIFGEDIHPLAIGSTMLTADLKSRTVMMVIDMIMKQNCHRGIIKWHDIKHGHSYRVPIDCNCGEHFIPHPCSVYGYLTAHVTEYYQPTDMECLYLASRDGKVIPYDKHPITQCPACDQRYRIYIPGAIKDFKHDLLQYEMVEPDAHSEYEAVGIKLVKCDKDVAVYRYLSGQGSYLSLPLRASLSF